jgi:hypothetical protein
MGTDFDAYLAGNSVSSLISNFTNQATKEGKILEAVLKSQ